MYTLLLLLLYRVVQLHPACEAASGERRVVRPLPPQPQLAAQVAGRVAGWSKARVRDELGLDKMLGEDAQVSGVGLFLGGCLRRQGPQNGCFGKGAGRQKDTREANDRHTSMDWLV
jgi:hypothetical protein